MHRKCGQQLLQAIVLHFLPSMAVYDAKRARMDVEQEPHNMDINTRLQIVFWNKIVFLVICK